MALSERTELWRRATRLVPGGVNSPVRAMRAVGLDEPVFVRRGDGALVEDVEGNRYVDWVQSWGPLLFGHADPETLEAVHAAVDRGTTFGAPTEAEVELAAEIVDAVPSIEMVRLVSSGTEASMSALRLARGATRRDRVIKFAGLLPRPRRRAPRERRLGRDDARPPLDAGHARRRHGRHDRLPLQRRRRRRRGLRAVRRGARRDPRRAGGREHGLRPAGAGLPRGAPGARRRDGRAARVRRGDDRLPGRARRRAGALRRPARPDHPRQDRRRRAPGGGLRGPRRADGAARARRRRLPGRDALREPARDRCGHLRAPTSPRRRRLRGARATRRAPRGTGSRRSALCSASARC